MSGCCAGQALRVEGAAPPSSDRQAAGTQRVVNAKTGFQAASTMRSSSVTRRAAVQGRCCTLRALPPWQPWLARLPGCWRMQSGRQTIRCQTQVGSSTPPPVSTFPPKHTGIRVPNADGAHLLLHVPPFSVHTTPNRTSLSHCRGATAMYMPQDHSIAQYQSRFSGTRPGSCTATQLKQAPPPLPPNTMKMLSRRPGLVCTAPPREAGQLAQQLMVLILGGLAQSLRPVLPSLLAGMTQLPAMEQAAPG